MNIILQLKLAKSMAVAKGIEWKGARHALWFRRAADIAPKPVSRPWWLRILSMVTGG